MPAALRKLSVLAVGGATVSRSLRERVLRELTPGLHIGYATNETALLTSIGGMAALGRADTIGYPLPSGEVQIVDVAGQALPPDVVGQIRVRSDAMVRGYVDDPEAERMQFRDGWFYPGDLGCGSHDGQVIFKGRADDLMIFSGVNIYPLEIEACLQAHPRVVEAVSFPIKSDRHGDIPMAAVRVRGEVSEEELIGFAKERLGARHPRKVLVVDDFPRNEAGKPLTREMARMLRADAE